MWRWPLPLVLLCASCAGTSAPPSTPPASAPAQSASALPSTSALPSATAVSSASASPDAMLHIESDPSKLPGKKPSATKPLPTFEEALKSQVTEADADTLTTKECASPVGGQLAAVCGLTGKASASLAVRNGRLIGATVTSEPDQPTVNECLRDRIRALTWRAVPGVTTCVRAFKVSP